MRRSIADGGSLVPPARAGSPLWRGGMVAAPAAGAPPLHLQGLPQRPVARGEPLQRAGLGAPEKVWTRITNASALYDLCHRLFEERLLIATLPKVAAAAAGLSSADPMARHCALTSGGFSLHRYTRDVEGQIPKWKPSDCDVFIPCGGA